MFISQRATLKYLIRSSRNPSIVRVSADLLDFGGSATRTRTRQERATPDGFGQCYTNVETARKEPNKLVF